MKVLFDFFPILLFFVAFKAYDIYVATGVAIAASLVQVGWLKLSGRKVETMHWITLAGIVVFGGLTIALHDDTFIRWKPTVVYWLFSLILLATQFFGKKTAIERVMGAQIQLPEHIWRNMNLSFVVFTTFMGFLNLYVAFVYGSGLDPDVQREHWVNFKVFGTLGLTLIFMFVVMALVSKHIKTDQAESQGES